MLRTRSAKPGPGRSLPRNSLPLRPPGASFVGSGRSSRPRLLPSVNFNDEVSATSEVWVIPDVFGGPSAPPIQSTAVLSPIPVDDERICDPLNRSPKAPLFICTCPWALMVNARGPLQFAIGTWVPTSPPAANGVQSPVFHCGRQEHWGDGWKAGIAMVHTPPPVSKQVGKTATPAGHDQEESLYRCPVPALKRAVATVAPRMYSLASPTVGHGNGGRSTLGQEEQRRVL